MKQTGPKIITNEGERKIKNNNNQDSNPSSLPTDNQLILPQGDQENAMEAIFPTATINGQQQILNNRIENESPQNIDQSQHQHCNQDLEKEKTEMKNQNQTENEDEKKGSDQNVDIDQNQSSNTPNDLFSQLDQISKLDLENQSQNKDSLKVNSSINQGSKNHPINKTSQNFAPFLPLSPHPPTVPNTSHSRYHQVTSRTQPINSPQLNNNEFIINDKSIPLDDPHSIKSIDEYIIHLEEELQEQLETGQFQQSEQQQKAIDTAKEAQMKAYMFQNQKKVKEEIRLKKNENDIKLETINKELAEKEKQLESWIKTYQTNISIKHDSELEQFDQLWHSETKLKRYNRVSRNIRILEIQRQNLLNVKRYEEASQIAKLIEQSINAETKANYSLLLKEYNAARSKLLLKQQQEKERSLKVIAAKRSEFDCLKEKTIAPIKKRQQNLDLEESLANDPEKLWARQKHLNNNITSKKTPRRSTRIIYIHQQADYNVLPLPPLPNFH